MNETEINQLLDELEYYRYIYLVVGAYLMDKDILVPNQVFRDLEGTEVKLIAEIQDDAVRLFVEEVETE